MLVEGRIKQPPSTRSVDSRGAASVSSSPDPVPEALELKCSRPSAPQRLSHIQSTSRSFTTHSNWRNRLPLNRVRHWLQDLICKLLILTAYFASSVPLPSSTSAPVRTLLSISVRPTSTSQLRSKCIHSRLSHLVFISLVVMTVTSVSVHCLNSHSPSQPSQHSTTHPSTTNHQLRQMFEKQFLNMMGLNSQPRPPPNHKVPEYMLDLYHWFRSSYRERKWLEEQTESDAVSSYRDTSHNGPIVLTSDDLWDATNSRDLDESELDEDEVRVIQKINGHHRVPAKRRSSQVPRVTLKGPANTIISHKLVDHDDGRINRRRRSTESMLSQSDTPSEEVHLKFNLHLPNGEFLKGAELRLYRHSIYDLGHPADQSVISNKTSSLTRHWPLYHWSVRYRSDSPTRPSSAGSPSSINASNSHPLAQKHSSGEKYSGKQPDHEYMQRINVYHLLRPIDELQAVTVQTSAGQTNRMLPVTKLIDTQVIDVRESGWLSFDIYPAIDRWIKHPNENFGLLITLTDSKGRHPSRHSNLVVVNHQESHVQSTSQPEKDSAWHEVQPLVITFSNKEDHKQDLLQSKLNRVKREHQRGSKKSKSRHRHNKSRKSNLKKLGSHRDKCSRQPLFFDFHMVGWMDWIVAPPGFQAYFCQGECSFPMESHLNYTNHATIQSLVNSVNKAVVPTPCCVPTDLSAITLLYHDVNGKVVLTNYHDMVVEGCGCR